MSDEAALAPADFTPPHPGSPLMPRWQGGELPSPPVFTWGKIAAFVGPGLVAGASAIGAGEWLNGPMVCARYGGALLWLATLSILGQVVYNMEVSRYTLYSGESIFTGKFRTMPGPLFWLGVYLILDFGTIFPYLAASAGTPIAYFWLGRMPDPDVASDKRLLEWISYGVFLLAIVPLIFGGKVYNSIRVLMTFKIFVVLGFLTILALFYSKPATWLEIGSGFFKFGSVPVMKGEDADGDGVLDPGEDWDGDGRLDGIEQRNDKNKNGDPHEFGEFIDADGDKRYDGYKAENIFVNLWNGRPLPHLDLSMIAILGAMAALAGNGGLTNTNVSGYTRDQGWGMGKHVGAIPSVVGGHSVKLSHVGMVFPITPENKKKFHGWYRHVFRDQFFLFGIASFIGLAMPSMLSVQFLERGTDVNTWLAAGMTAQGVYDAIDSDGNKVAIHFVGVSLDGAAYSTLDKPVFGAAEVIGQKDAISHPPAGQRSTADLLPPKKSKPAKKDDAVPPPPEKPEPIITGIAVVGTDGAGGWQYSPNGETWSDIREVSRDRALLLDAGTKVRYRPTTFFGPLAWFVTLFCGFLVLALSTTTTADGYFRRWIDVLWTGLPALRKWKPHSVGKLYFGMLCIYCTIGLFILAFVPQGRIMIWATNIYNYALGISCLHVLYVNCSLLPKELRPNWFTRVAMVVSAIFFIGIAAITTTHLLSLTPPKT